MKLIIKSVIFLFVFTFSLFADITIIKNDKAHAEIVVDGSADSLTLKAASILQRYLLKMTDVRLNIQVTPSTNIHHIFIGKKFLKQVEERKLNAENYDDAFILCSKNGGFHLAGKKPIGDLYAVYALLEEYLGCIKFTVDEEFIPSIDKINLPEICKVFKPAFPFRVPHFPGRNDPGFREWHRINSFEDWGMFVHTFHRLVPPEKYFKEHPEYFALISNRRLQDGQLCLANPDLIDLLIENLGKEIAKHPEKKYWSVSQNDCINYCECEKCQNLYDEYGSVSGAYIRMANQIARTFPEKQISTLAYQFTRSAPENIKPLKNVNIMFCSIECNRSMPGDESNKNTGLVVSRVKKI